MQFNLKKSREALGLTCDDISKAAGICLSFYKQYESQNRIPCKYVYNIWKAYPEYPLPEDFFYYTSFTLQTNMIYHNMTQTEIAKKFGFSSQGIISKFLADNIPMYELKGLFLETFDPVIIPLKRFENGELGCIKDLVPRGNFMKRTVKRKKQGEANIKRVEIKE